MNYRQEEQKFIAAELLGRILEILPPEDVWILQTIDGDGESFKSVTELMNWSQSKVKIKAFRARKKIPEAMQKLLPSTD